MDSGPVMHRLYGIRADIRSLGSGEGPEAAVLADVQKVTAIAQELQLGHLEIQQRKSGLHDTQQEERAWVMLNASLLDKIEQLQGGVERLLRDLPFIDVSEVKDFSGPDLLHKLVSQLKREPSIAFCEELLKYPLSESQLQDVVKIYGALLSASEEQTLIAEASENKTKSSPSAVTSNQPQQEGKSVAFLGKSWSSVDEVEEAIARLEEENGTPEERDLKKQLFYNLFDVMEIQSKPSPSREELQQMQEKLAILKSYEASGGSAAQAFAQLAGAGELRLNQPIHFLGQEWSSHKEVDEEIASLSEGLRQLPGESSKEAGAVFYEMQEMLEVLRDVIDLSVLTQRTSDQEHQLKQKKQQLRLYDLRDKATFSALNAEEISELERLERNEKLLQYQRSTGVDLSQIQSAQVALKTQETILSRFFEMYL